MSFSSLTGRRVVITGMGTVNPLGLSVPQTHQALLNGKSGIGRITRFDASDYPCQIAGEVKRFDPLKWIAQKDLDKMDLFIQFAVAAADEAMNDAGFGRKSLSDQESERFGVLIGSGIGGLMTIYNQAGEYFVQGDKKRKRPDGTPPPFIPSLIVNNASGEVSLLHGLRGPNSAVATACATGGHAIGDAATHIMLGRADRMVAGGAEAIITPLGVGGFGAMKALSTQNKCPKRASRPFDTARDGFVPSEGAAVVVLEEYKLAVARGATIYAEIIGYGMAGDAHSLFAPDPTGSGARRSMQAALMDACIQESWVSYINAHGTSTQLGDRTECAAIREVFKAHANDLQISSTKSCTGHLIGAAGALETIVCAKVAQDGNIPPTINIENQDPKCDLNITANQSSFIGSGRRRIVMNNSFGFGGTNTTLILQGL